MATKPKTDPFENDDLQTQYKSSVKETLKSAERGTFVETALATSEPIQGELVPYTRVVDLSDDLKLEQLEDWQGVDLAIWRYDEWNGDLGKYLTMEVSDGVEAPHFLVNCGGTDAMRKIKAAFQAVEAKKATLPLVACFKKLSLAGGQRSFWLVS
jgi:hypothetical protein